MCIDSWYARGYTSAGKPQNQLERRRHDLSDAIAILGPWNQQRLISNYSTSAAELRTEDDTVKVSVQGAQVTVSAPTVNVTASAQVNISGSGHTSIEGKDFLTHKHTGVSTGGGTSGPVF
jgi:phage baseplate assembly protein gpV